MPTDIPKNFDLGARVQIKINNFHLCSDFHFLNFCEGKIAVKIHSDVAARSEVLAHITYGNSDRKEMFIIRRARNLTTIKKSLSSHSST